MPHPHDTWPKRPPVPIVTVRGTPYEMGLQHGQQYAEVIRTSVRNWVDGYVKGQEDKARRVTEHQFPSNQRIYPALFDELRGIADGSGAPYESIVQMNFRVWNHIGLVEQTACTTIGFISEEDGVVVGANLDDPRECYGLIRRDPVDGLTHVTNTWIGSIWSVDGANEAGLVLAQASLGHPDWQRYKDVVTPRENYFGTVARRMLETCADIPQAVALLREFPTYNNWVLGDAKGDLVCIQCWGSAMGLQRAADHDNMVFTSNHHFMPEVVAALAAQGMQPSISDYSRVRFEVLERARKNQPRNRATMESLLRSHEGSDQDGLTCICNTGTALSMYGMPQTRPGVLYVADQPPCRNDYMEYPVTCGSG